MKSLFTVISLALAFVSPAFAGIEWGFPNDSGTYSGIGGAGIATVTVGAFGSGYHDAGSAAPWNLGSSGIPATGFWDLGQRGAGQAGSIVLSGLTGSGPMTLNVFQWVDPSSPYNGNNLSFIAGNGNSGTFTQVGNAIGGTVRLPGAWWEYTANLGTLIPGETVTVSAGTGGAIINNLALVPEPATMIAGAILLIPFALSTWPILRRRRTS